MAAVCKELRVETGKQHQKRKSSYLDQRHVIKQKKENVWESFLWTKIRNAALFCQLKDAQNDLTEVTLSFINFNAASSCKTLPAYRWSCLGILVC